MLKKVEDLTVPESKGINTVPNFFSLQKDQSPNMMDVRINYDGSIEQRLGSNTQNTLIIAASAAAGFKTNSTGTLANSARSYWQLNETSDSRFDSIGNVTLLDSGMTLYSAGIQSQAALFSAATGQCLYATNPPTLTGNGNFSISSWIYLNSVSTSSQRTIVSKSDYAPGKGQAGTDTVLLLHMNGAEASTTFTDDSRYHRTMTAVAGAKITSAQSVFGGAAGQFNGSTDYITAPYSTDLDFGTGDFTIDLRLRYSAFSPGDISGVFGDYNVGSVAMYTSTANGGTLTARLNGIASSVTGSGIAINNWYHLAIVRSSTILRFYKDGVQVGPDTISLTAATATNGTLFYIGNLNGGSSLHNGWIDEFRVSNIAKWATNFTSPTLAYSNSPNEFEYWLYVDTNNKVTFDISSSGLIANASVVANSFGALSTATWYNCVGYVDSANGLIGVGVNLQVNSATYTSVVKTSSAPFTLGAISNGAGAFMDGRIDETGYWNRALTSGERNDLYNTGLGNTYTSGFDTQPWGCFDFGASSIRWLTVAAGTGLYASSNLGVTFVNIATDRTATYQYLDRSKNVLVATSDAYDPPLAWSGSAGTFATLLNVSAPLCKYNINFQGFLILLNSSTRKRGFFYQDENTQLTGAWANNFDIPSSADDEITSAIVLRRYLYVSTRYKLYRVSYVGGNPDWQFIEVKGWGFVPRTAKKIILTNNQPGVGFYYSIGEVAVGLTWDRKVRIFDGSGDQIVSNPIELDNNYCEFALNKISYFQSGPLVSFAEVDPNQNIYRLALAIGKDSKNTTHFINYDGRALAWYPYSNMRFNCMTMAESANQRFLMAFDRSGNCHMMDSGNLDSNTTQINGLYDSPFLYEKSPSQSSKGHRTDLFFSNTSAGNILYSDRLDGSNLFIQRKIFKISGSAQKLIHYESIDTPETYNIYQFRISHVPSNSDPWKLLRYDHFVSGLGIGKND